MDDSSLVGYERADAYSGDYSFTTQTASSISNVTITDIGLDSAVINWSAKSMESAVIEYGETTAYGKSIEVASSGENASPSARLAGLTHSTTYNVRVKGVDIDANDLVSDNYVFTTLFFPKITALVLNTDQGEAGTTAVLAWATNIPTSSTVEYQAVTASDYNTAQLTKLTQAELEKVAITPKGTKKTVSSPEFATKHLERISSLADGSLYVFTVRGRDEKGNEVIGDPIRYVTGLDTRPPAISNMIIETPLSGSGADAKAQVIVSWDTDEPSYGQVAWGMGSGSEYPQLSEKEESLTTKHVIVLRDLALTTSYHLKIISTDKTGNKIESQDTVVVTPTAQAAAFDVIINNLEDIFGFLKL